MNAKRREFLALLRSYSYYSILIASLNVVHISLPMQSRTLGKIESFERMLTKQGLNFINTVKCS